MSPPTLQDIRAAKEFGPRLCYPVADLIGRFDNYLPPEDVFITAAGFGIGSTYLAPGSEETTYLHQTLADFKRILAEKRAVKMGILAPRFDPAIKFFEGQLEKGSGVRINCFGIGPESAKPPLIPHLQGGKIDAAAIKEYLKKRFGLMTIENLEEWLGHRIYYAQIKKEADYLLMIVPDNADNQKVLYDELFLLQNLIQSADRYDLIMALDARKGQLDQILAAAEGSESKFERLRHDANFAASARYMLTGMLTEEFIRNFCQSVTKKYPNISFATCKYNCLLPLIMMDILSVVFSDKAESYWPLDEKDFRDKYLPSILTLNSDLPTEQAYQLNQEITQGIRRRNQVVAKSLAKKIRKESYPKRPRIILLPSAPYQTSAIINNLPDDLPISILGLLSHNFADQLFRVPRPR